jgi:glycosyltransferase involved in cell wall biosynthesis
VVSSVGVIRDAPGLEAPLCQHAAQLGFATHVIDAPGRVNLSAVTSLRSLIVRERIDIVHSHGYKTDLVACLATIGLSCRAVSTPHGWSTQAGLALRIYETLDRMAFPFFDAVAPLSEPLRDELSRWPFFSKRLHLIRNGVDISEIDAVHSPAPEAVAWQAQGDYVIGYIGQLISRKGLDVLLRAFAALDVPAKRLVLVGEGPQRDELESLARALGCADRVQFMGFRTDRLALLKGFDVFALPSRLEGIPRCLMESMAAGIPIVSSDIPGSADLIRPADAGLLFPLDDVAALTASLDRLREPALRESIAARGRQHVVAEYSAASMARQYDALFQRLYPAERA